MKNFWLRFITVPSSDPDDARRRQLLNILLSGFAILAVLLLLTVPYVGTTPSEIGLLYAGNLTFLFALIIIYVINRYWLGWLASSMLVISLSVAMVFSDAPVEVAAGRTLVVFGLPVVLASIILPPFASFIVAGLCSLLIYLVAVSTPGVVANTPAMVTYFAIALVSWLSGRTLERALRDLRVLNRDLDQRVQDRTRELSEALSREQAEASKNQAILQSIADGVIVFDEQNQAVTANPAISELLDQPLNRIIARNTRQLMGTAVSALQQDTVTALFQNKDARPEPINVDWGPKTISVSVAPLQAAAGTLGGSVAVFRDVTREAEVSRMKSAFVSMVSHELRTPLNAIQGYAEILQQKVHGPLNEKQVGVADRIMTNTDRLLTIVGDLLDQAHIEAGTLSIQNTSFAPADLVDSVCGVVSGMAQSKGLLINTTIEPNLPTTLTGDPHRLNQVLLNLVTNAVKYTDTGSVSIHLYRPDANNWKIEVSDTGRGISPSAQAYIFEPFRQVDSSIGRKQGGVGLGLSIVKRLVGLMRGEIKVSSEVGRGSTFTVILPLNPARVFQPQIHINY